MKELDGTHSERSAWKEEYQPDFEKLVEGMIGEECL